MDAGESRFDATSSTGNLGPERKLDLILIRSGFDVDPTVFLDLPAPWEAIPHAVKALRVSAKRSMPFVTANPASCGNEQAEQHLC